MSAESCPHRTSLFTYELLVVVFLFLHFYHNIIGLCRSDIFCSMRACLYPESLSGGEVKLSLTLSIRGSQFQLGIVFHIDRMIVRMIGASSGPFVQDSTELQVHERLHSPRVIRKHSMPPSIRLECLT